MANIIEDVQKVIKEFKDSMNSAAAQAYSYNSQYEEYISKHVKDATLLKDRMIEKIIKVMPDESR